MPNRPAIFHPKGPKKAARPSYDTRRGSAHRRGYNRNWEAFSEWYRSQHPFCVMCEADGNLVAAECVDHKIPVTGPDDPSFFLEEAVQSLCWSCHSVKTSKQDGGLRGKGN